MKRSIITLTLLSLALFAADQARAQLFGVNGNATPGRSGDLFTIDSITGAATTVGALGVSGTGGLAFDPNSSTLYSYQTGPSGGQRRLLTIDATTGAATVVGAGGTIIGGLAFDPNTNTLYGASNSNLITIATADGARTTVGPFGVSNMVGLAFDANTNTLYGTDRGSNLRTIDTTTGAATLVGATGFRDIQGLAFDAATNALYGVGASASEQLLTINTTTGAATVVAPLAGNPDLRGLAVGPDPLPSVPRNISPQEIISSWERTPEPTANTLAGRDRWQANGDILSYTDNAASAVISPNEKTDGFEFRALFKAPNDNDLVGLVFGFQDIDNNYRLSFSGGGVRDYTFRGLSLVKEVGGVPTALFNDINIKWMPNTYYELIVGRDAAGDLYFEVIQAGLGAIAQGTVADNTFTSGKVGIYARSQRADFSQIVCVD